MDDKMRAIKYCAAAIILLEDPLEEDTEMAIALLEKALNLYSDLNTHVLIGDAWHYFLKSLDPDNDSGTYEKYLKSSAWYRKQELVMKRDENICVRCRAKAEVVHHKTYDNIGKEPLCDLVALCHECHEGGPGPGSYHRKRHAENFMAEFNRGLEYEYEELVPHVPGDKDTLF